MPINYKDYHPKWSLIRRLILRRAHNRCEQCGINNYATKDNGTLVCLTIAHMDRNRNNNRFGNLKALCQKCHLKHDIWQHVFNRKYGRLTKVLNYKLFD